MMRKPFIISGGILPLDAGVDLWPGCAFFGRNNFAIWIAELLLIVFISRASVP